MVEVECIGQNLVHSTQIEAAGSVFLVLGSLTNFTISNISILEQKHQLFVSVM